MSIRVAIGGGTGRLGSLVCKAVSETDDMTLTGVVVSADGGNVGRDVYGTVAVGPDSLESVLRGCDVYVDLTNPAAASEIIAKVPGTGANLILGTTAVDREAMDAMEREVARCGTSALVSHNFSIGVNVFLRVSEILAGYLRDYDIEVIEAHHGTKRDSPSGTAKEAVRRLQDVTGIQDVVNGREGVLGVRPREIGVHSIRAGNIVGDHTVIFAKNNERVELTHKAISRESLADGCIEAIRWMAGRHDGIVHEMNEVLDL